MSLLRWEWKKIWQGRGWMLPVALAAILLLSAIVNFAGLRPALNGTLRRVNGETRAFWGQPVTQEVRDAALPRLESLGAAVKKESWGSVSCDISPVMEQYGPDSYEMNAAVLWSMLLDAPTLEEDRQNYEDMLLAEKEAARDDPEALAILQAREARRKDPAAWYVAPSTSAWTQFLNPGNYGALMAGLVTLALMILLLSDSFAREQGSLGAISLIQPKSRRWLHAKILCAALSGALIAASLSLGLLFVYGLVYGFQGGTIGALSSLGLYGYVYGELVADVPCWQLAALLILARACCGACLGVILSACSALTRRAPAAAALFLGLVLALLSLMVLEGAYFTNPAHMQQAVDSEGLAALTLTPVRLFLNPEIFTARFERLPSAYGNERLFNVLLAGDLRWKFAGVVAGITALFWALAALCGRRRA